MVSKLAISLVMILLTPVYLVLGLLVWTISGWPIFFVQERVGKDGRIFKMYKFRTMRNGAEKDQQSLKQLNEADGPAFKIYDDPRLTKIGKFLFHTGLDELPQLFNILKGDMDLIGPRPLPVNEEREIDKKYRLERRRVRPGIISPWILNGYHKLTFEEWMESDIAYIKNKCWLDDIKLIIEGSFLMVKLVVKEVF